MKSTKGGIEFDESAKMAAARELAEEAGLADPVEIGGKLGSLEYELGRRATS